MNLFKPNSVATHRSLLLSKYKFVTRLEDSLLFSLVKKSFVLLMKLYFKRPDLVPTHKVSLAVFISAEIESVELVLFFFVSNSTSVISLVFNESLFNPLVVPIQT